MMYKISSLITGFILVCAMSFGAEAQSFQDGHQNAAYAGVYLSFSLGEQKRTTDDPLKFGFKAGFRRDMRRSNNGILRTSSFTADMVKLDFSDRGFRALTLAGSPLVQTDRFGRTFYLGDDGEDDKDGKDGISVGKVLLWTGGILVGVVIVSIAVQCAEGADEDLIDLCPVN